MTELETMKRAKMYLDKLANGINPLTDQPVPDSDCINQVKISRCLFYVSDVLQGVIEGDCRSEKPKKPKKSSFTITQEDLKKYQFANNPIPVSEVTNRINDLVDLNTMFKLKYTSITTFLLQCGFLVQGQYVDGRTFRSPTDQGKALGISSEERTGQAGTYHVTVYNAAAQQFILDNIDAVIEINNQKPSTSEKTAEYQGQPWTTTYDETLIDLFQKNVPVSEIAVTLKRSEGGIRARLKKLGFIEKRSDAN